jgi:hypothetical protein
MQHELLPYCLSHARICDPMVGWFPCDYDATLSMKLALQWTQCDRCARAERSSRDRARAGSATFIIGSERYDLW